MRKPPSTNADLAAIYRMHRKKVTPRLADVARAYGQQPAALVNLVVALAWASDAGFTRPDVLEIIEAHFPAVAPPQLTVVSQ
jgi:hypothetical protein